MAEVRVWTCPNCGEGVEVSEDRTLTICPHCRKTGFRTVIKRYLNIEMFDKPYGEGE